MSDAPSKLRIDKWLWFARFFKTRGLAAKVVGGGRCRVNGVPVAKASVGLQAGDVVTFPQGRDVRVIRVEALGTRRGPAPEAQALYTDLDPPGAAPADPRPSVPRYDKGGRPTKRDRRQITKSQAQPLE